MTVIFRVSNRRERRRQSDHRIVVRAGVHAEPVQLVRAAGQPPRRRAPSHSAHEPDPDQSAARAHTDRLHGRSDESHVGRLLPAPANASAFLHVVLTWSALGRPRRVDCRRFCIFTPQNITPLKPLSLYQNEKFRVRFAPKPRLTGREPRSVDLVITIVNVAVLQYKHDK